MDGFPLPLPDVLKSVSHEVRWKLLQLLARSDYRGQDLVEKLKLPQNLISYHLKQLRQSHLITERRSSADERAIFYSLNVGHLQQLYLEAGEVLHPAVTMSIVAPTAVSNTNATKPQGMMIKGRSLRVLFLCTENSARSQMAEALLRHLSHGTMEAFSAGSMPAEQIHPLARRCMEDIGIDMSRAVPKHFEIFQGLPFDAIITVCDRVREVCPTFPDDSEHIHWSFPDPAEVEGSEEVRLANFEQTALQLTTRIRYLITLLQREKGYQ